MYIDKGTVQFFLIMVLALVSGVFYQQGVKLETELNQTRFELQRTEIELSVYREVTKWKL